MYDESKTAADPIIRMGLAVARRFLDRVSDSEVRQCQEWSAFQVEEVNLVLRETGEQFERVASGMRPVWPHPLPKGGPVTIRDGMFHTDTTEGEDRPYFFYGYGHFDQIFLDLPNWSTLGVTLLQDGRVGPSGMNPDGSFVEEARPGLNESVSTVLADLRRAARYGIYVDFLLSPHYFPDWAWEMPGNEELRGKGDGFITFNIDHPIAREVIETWTDRVSKALDGHDALFSVCLSNEPMYNRSGRDTYSLPMYQRYLAQRHKDIETLNGLYGSEYDGFDEVQPPQWHETTDIATRRRFYDYKRFNQKHLVEWHAWMADRVREHLPETPIHAKPMIFYALDRDSLSGWNQDPELYCAISDIAGCDVYAYPDEEYASYDWLRYAFWYDLLHAFHGQPVFNSENHVIRDGTEPDHIPMSMTRTQFWHGALHHQAATTTWVWEEAISKDGNVYAEMAGSIYYRPANVYGASRAFIEINQFAHEVSAINRARPRVALLYSQPSVFWEEAYRQTILDAYTSLNFLGETVTFVSERMLQEERVPAVDWIILPQATHVKDATVAGLEAFLDTGGAILALWTGNLAFDDYHRRRETLPPIMQGMPQFDFTGQPEIDQAALFEILSRHGTPPPKAINRESGAFVWNVEYRAVEYNGKTLMPVINFDTKKVTLYFPDIEDKEAVDLLSGEATDLTALELEPMEPKLLLIS